MTWYAWLLLAWFAFAGGCTVYSIGRTRKPTTPEVAVITLIVVGLQAWAIVSLAAR